MAMLQFNSISISGIAACVPKNIAQINAIKGLMTKRELQKAINFTGVQERRFAGSTICSSDLCHAAALKLFDDLHIKPETVDMLIFVSQTPDFRLPATACTLQHRLNLPKSAAAFDVNLGCSGYVYGLSIAFSFASQNGIHRILLLCGETSSKVVSSRDRATTLLFGDAGTATLIEKNANIGNSYFSLNTDGAGQDVIKIKAGGYRLPSSSETLCAREREDGSIRNDEQIFMNGAEVFNFTIKDAYQDIHKVLAFSDNVLKDIDFIVFHQANKFIIEYLARKLSFPIERVPMSLKKFGNTSCATIPLTIVTEMRQELNSTPKKIIMSGFGVGLSWATTLLEMADCHIADLTEL